MFLNTDTFNYGGHSIVLSELSALQRVDYLKFIQQRTADYDAQPETLTEAERQTEFMQIQFCGAVGYSECGRRRVPFGRTQPVQRQHC